MVKLNLFIPGGHQQQELFEGAAVLIGRAPNPAEVDLSGLPCAPKLIELPSPRISSNHLLAWRQGGATRLQDLGSKNGSRLALTPGTTVTVASSAPVTLELAGCTAGIERSGPAPVGDIGRDYAQQLTHEIGVWLSSMTIEARVAVEPHREGSQGSRGAERAAQRFPLADGRELVVERMDGVGTEHVAWFDCLEILRAYIHEQNGRVAHLCHERHDGKQAHVFASPAIIEVHRQVWEAARLGRRLLLLGPTGAGKSSLARCYHEHSFSEDKGPYRELNCGQYIDAKQFLTAALFGAVRGAWTDLRHDVRGMVEEADGGTLFLDEIGELDAAGQALLLRFLDTGSYSRVGETKVRAVKVRTVFATNRDLRDAVRRGAFRSDLWYRIAVVVVDVPALRERPQDIEAYVDRLRWVEDGPTCWEALTPAARRVVLAHSWSGSFRELSNFFERLPAPAGAIDEEQCRRAIAAGAVAGEFAPARVSLAVEDVEHDGEAMITPAVWRRALEGASERFLAERDAGAPGSTEAMMWDGIKRFVEDYLKPLLARLGVSRAEELPAEEKLRYEPAARRLGIADGATLKKYLQKYRQMFLDGKREPRDSR